MTYDPNFNLWSDEDFITCIANCVREGNRDEAVKLAELWGNNAYWNDGRRVPFLDNVFIELMQRIDSTEQAKMREAFYDVQTAYEQGWRTAEDEIMESTVD